MRRLGSNAHAGRRLVAGLAVAGGITLAACTPPPTPTPVDPTTPWFAAGCVDSSVPGVPDFEFSGVANEVGNGIGFDTGGGVLSEDGSCTGTESTPGTIIRAADQPGAIAACDALGITVTSPARLADFGYEAPVDAWTCLDAP